MDRREVEVIGEAGADAFFNPLGGNIPSALIHDHDGKGTYAADTNRMEHGHPPPLTLDTTLTSDETDAYDTLLESSGHYAWPQFFFHMFGWGPNRRVSTKYWPTELKWLWWAHVLVFLVSLGSALALWILTAINTFNIKMNWTTDFLLGGAYPAALHSVGFVKIGYFFATAFTIIAISSGFVAFWPRAFLHYYIKRQIRWRKDEFRTIALALAIVFIAIGICGGLGITNVFVIIPWVVSILAIFINSHYLPEKHYGATAEILNATVPVIYQHEGEVRTEPARELSDNTSYTSDGKELNAHLGLCQEMPVLGLSKLVTLWLMKAREVIGAPIKTFLSPDRQRDLLFHYATLFSYVLNPNLWIVFATLPSIIIALIVPIVYYGGALHNSGSTYSNYVHATLWLFMFALFFDMLVAVLYWSIWNARTVVNRVLNRPTSHLIIGGVGYTIFSYVYWLIFLIPISFVFLGGLHNSASSHLY